MRIRSLDELYRIAEEITRQAYTKGTDAFKKVHYYNAIPVITNDGRLEWYTPEAFWPEYNQGLLKRVDNTIVYVYKDLYEHLVKSKSSVAGGNIMYVEYKGRKIPFGPYVIWDDTRNIFLAFNDINALNNALKQYGYVKDHSAVREGYYTRYGYFSNDILYDLYLKYRYPEVYSTTAQKIVLQHFKQYNANPEAFRRQLLQNIQVRREITQRHESYATKSAEEKIQQLEREIQMLKNSRNQSIQTILQTLEKEYESLVEFLKSIGRKAPAPSTPVRTEKLKQTDLVQAISQVFGVMAMFVIFGMMIKLIRGLRA